MKRNLLALMGALLLLCSACAVAGPPQNGIITQAPSPPRTSKPPTGLSGGIEDELTDDVTDPTDASDTTDSGVMKASSTAISGGVLDNAFGANGEQKTNKLPSRSPPITIKNAPADTKSYALVVTDTDASRGSPLTLWLLCDLTETELPENASQDKEPDFVQGKNSYKLNAYTGPIPIKSAHTIDIHVYALDSLLSLSSGFSEKELMDAMEGHILAECRLRAKYKRPG